MDIAVIGGGSVGLLAAFFLHQAGERVTVYTRTVAQANEISEKGLIYLVNDTKKLCRIQALPVSHFQFGPKIVVAVKQNAMKSLGALFKDKRLCHSDWLFLQNGMGHIRLMESLPSNQVSIGLVEHGALRSSLSEVIHTGIGRLKLAPMKGSAEAWEKLFVKGGSEIELKTNYYEAMTEKLIVNCCINPLTAIFKVTNGQLLHNPHYFNLMKLLFDETFQALSITREKEGMWEELIRICKNTFHNRSSMLRDIEKGIVSEIDAITGFVLEEGRKKNLSLPFTLMIYQAVKGLEWKG